jgi:hypothetical protein
VRPGATLGEAAERGDPIAIWCNNKACGYWQEHGRQYRAVLSAADLAGYAERYGEAATFEDFRSRLRCRRGGCWEVLGGSYLIVERVEIKKWPDGSAYHYHGRPSGPKTCRLTILRTRRVRLVSVAVGNRAIAIEFMVRAASCAR